MYDDQIAFFIYNKGWHETNYPLKGNEAQGLLGLYVHRDAVMIIPQENSTIPQMAYYKMDDQDSVYIHILMTYLKMHLIAPAVPQSAILSDSRIHGRFMEAQLIGSTNVRYNGRILTELYDNGVLGGFRVNNTSR